MSRKKKKKNKTFQPIPRERALVVREEALGAAHPAPEDESRDDTPTALSAGVDANLPIKAEDNLPASADRDILPAKADGNLPAEKTDGDKKRKHHRHKIRVGKKPKNPKRSRILWTATWALCAALLVGVVFVFDIPHWQSLDVNKLTKLAQTSRMYDTDGALITALRGRENRTVIKLAQVPADVQNAFIAAEDLRFYQHNGFDLVRIAGAVLADLKSQSYGEGASTITQQLIKLTHLSQIKTLARKGEEVFLAMQVEAKFTKEEILEMYLNTVYFGEGAHGIEAAAERYFGKHASELTVTEGAALAATIKAPSAYGPTTSAETNKTRRNYIIGTMEANGMITPEKAEAAKAEELVIAAQVPYTLVHGWFVDAALEEAEAVLGLTADELLSGGYFIETTMNPALQTLAEDLYANAGNFPANASDGTKCQSAMAVTDVRTGGYVAIVGGREYTVQRGFNRATHMRRSPGSAIKPLAVYAPAIQKGYTTASVVSDEQEDFGGGYSPRNAGNIYHGNVTLRRALALSMNVATVRLMKEIGIGTSMNFLKQAGIPLTDSDANLSLALGAMTTGVTPAEMAASYALFGNGGVYNAGYLVKSIYGPGGETVYEHKAEPRTVLNAQDNYLLTSMMQSVTSWGSGTKLGATGLNVAGKTGTNSLVGMSGNRDIWMAAFTSDYSVACWMGFDNTNATHRLASSTGGGGAPAALTAAFYRGAYKGQNKPSFNSPGGLVWVTIDTAATAAAGTPMLAGSYTPDDYKLSEVFLEGNRPWKTSSIWQAPRALSYFYIDYEASGYPKLIFGATDAANYRVERIQNGNATVVTELYGAAGQTLTYTDWAAVAGEWYTYRVTPVHTAMLEQGVLLEGPASSQSVQARAASGGFLDGVVKWFVNAGGN